MLDGEPDGSERLQSAHTVFAIRKTQSNLCALQYCEEHEKFEEVNEAVKAAFAKVSAEPDTRINMLQTYLPCEAKHVDYIISKRALLELSKDCFEAQMQRGLDDS